MEEVRIDKYLWSIRVFKTRTEASEACNGKVRLNGASVKASKSVKIGDKIEVRKGAILYTYRVLKLAEKRMGAALVPDFAENLTPQAELDKSIAPQETINFQRDRGTGRPSKKERRDLDALRKLLDFE